MLTVRITIGPNSQGAQRQIAKLCIANASELAPTSAYAVSMRDDQGSDQTFYLSGHRRDDGVWELVRRVCEVLLEDERSVDTQLPPSLDDLAQALLAELRHP